MACFVLACGSVGAQNYVRNGKEYSSVQTTKEKSEDENTGYVWKDKSGQTYEIFISKRNACYIWRTSKKTGKKYKYYFPKEVSQDIANQLGRDENVDYN